jgi:cell division protease FtsH
VQSEKLAAELVQRLPAAALATLIGTLSVASADVARAADYYTPPSGNTTTTETARPQQSLEFPSGSTAVAPPVKAGDFQLPEGNQWRYSEFINAVQAGKVERVRFSKDGSQLQVGHTLHRMLSHTVTFAPG